MKIENPFKISDWPINKFLIIVFSFQLLFLGTIGLDSIGLNVPILRQLICFIYLLFIPGTIILRILKLHNLTIVENILYSVGLSLSTLMFMGLFMNKFYPIIGISKPISSTPLILTIFSIVIVLCVLCYKRDKNFSDVSYLNIRSIFSAPALFLYLIPILTILGTYQKKLYGTTSLLMIVILLISMVVILVISKNIIPSNLYPLAIFVIAISLLFHNSLVSNYLSGWDIQIEYYTANNVINASLWNADIYSNINAMLSIVILAPIYSILSNLTLIWVFKIIYPLIFSLLPLGLYQIFQKQTTDKISFISTFFFMSFFGFYTDMTQLARQQIGEYFFVLFLLLIIQSEFNVANRILLTLFSYSIIVSHYGLSYLIMGSIICSSLILVVYQKRFAETSPNNTITVSFSLFFLVFLIAWYTYNTQSSAFNSVVSVVRSIILNLISDFMNPDLVQGLYIITKETASLSHELYKYLHIFTQVFISVGLLYVLRKKSSKHFKFTNEYLVLCVVFYMTLIASITIPNFSSSLNTSRVYQIALILLSPFCIIGGSLIISALLKRIPNLNSKEVNIFTLRTLSIFFAIFLLFNTGWIYEVMGDSPTSYSLSNTVDFPMFNKQDVAGRDWLYQVNDIKPDNGYIYADYYRWLLFLNCFERKYIQNLPKNINEISGNSYLYFSTYNILNNRVLSIYSIGANNILNYVDLNIYSSSNNLIYNNGNTEIYYQ